MSSPYVPGEIEPRWQDRWRADGIYRRPVDPERPYYALTMYPYPSGNLHIGHWFAYSPSDAHARFRRMSGHDVFFPFGFDAFGLPAENAAIRHGEPPREWTHANIDRMRTQLQSMGAMFDWDAEIITCEPEYYRWNQWFFLKFLEADLAYRARAAVDFCPGCNTTLAREQVVGEARECERCGTPVEKRELTQWFLRTTRYAEELLEGLDTLDWPDPVKTMQRNWIGRSRGATIAFPVDGGDPVTVFTTRPDTLFGATAVVLAPEHDAVDALTSAERRDEVAEYKRQASRRTEIDRLAADRTKTGAATGGAVRHPLSGAELPVWVADYVLPTYGFGAVMLVPAHDERDFEFAASYGLPVVQVVRPPDQAVEAEGHGLRPADAEAGAYVGAGTLVNSDPFDGLTTGGKDATLEAAYGRSGSTNRGGLPADAKAAITAALQEKGLGGSMVTYRLRDWLISRQRYWGTPIPIVHCPDCGPVPVPERELPVVLPEGVEFRPTGESPLKFADEWRVTTCPRCGSAAERDTDTMDTFVDSSWYQYRYLSPHETGAPFNAAEGRWLPVAKYTGGIEHATMHLLYTRFWTKAMRDLGLVDFDEPMLSLFNQGIIVGVDSEKMSKSRGNVVDPDNLVGAHGADAVRAYLMFIGPWDQGGPWDARGIQGVVRWLHDVWELATAGAGATGDAAASEAAQGDDRAEESGDLRRATHRTLAAVTEDLGSFAFNTAIAALMTLRNTLKEYRHLAGTPAWTEAVDTMLLMMAPLTPHIAEELWALRGGPYSIHQQAWPEPDAALLLEESVEVAVQIGGKVRDRITLPAGAAEADAVAAALATDAARRELEGRSPRRVIYVPDRVVNIVI